MTQALLRTSTLTLAICAFAVTACNSRGLKPKPDALVSIESIQAATVRWSANAGDSSERDAVKLSPYVNDDFLFSVDVTGKVSAFSVESGDRKWSTELNKDVTAGVNGDDKNLYLATANGEVFAISQSHGQHRLPEETTLWLEVLTARCTRLKKVLASGAGFITTTCLL